MNNQTTTASTEINYDLLARFQFMGLQIQKTRDAMWEGLNANGACDLKPREILTMKPKLEAFQSMFSYSNLEHPERINIPAGNEMLVEQAGRAWALSQSYEIVGNHMKAYEGQDAEYPTVKSSNPMNVVKYGKVLRHVITGQYIAAVMVIDRADVHPNDVCEVYKFNHDTNKWTLHPITILVRNGETKRDGTKKLGAFEWNRQLNEFTPAYTKYNFLAAMLTGKKIHIVYNYEKGVTLNTSTWYPIMLEMFRRELWSKVCGYGWAIEKAYVEMWDKVKVEVAKAIKSGEYTFEEIIDLI